MLDLTPQQKAAVQYVKGPLLILAGAGGGKTSLLAHKIAWLIREYGVDPAQILTLAVAVHTPRALRARVVEILGRKIATHSISTFQELGLNVLLQRPDGLGLRAGFSIYDRLESEAIIGQLLTEFQPHSASLAGAVSAHIARWKRALAAPAPADKPAAASAAADVAAWLYPRYERRLLTANAVDLEDLTAKAARLLAADEALLAHWRARTRFLLVDEYEQTGASEHELVRLLAADGVALTAAGDEMGASDDAGSEHAGNLVRLQSELADARIVKLEQNFRSTGRILRAAFRVSAPARPVPDAAPAHPLGAPLRVLRARSEQHEAEGIAKTLLDHKVRTRAGFGQYAILLFRAEQAAPIERALQAYRIPYHARRGSSFFEQTEVRDVWAYLKLMANPADDSAFLRAVNTPRRDVDRATLERLIRFASERDQPLLASALDPALAQALPPVELVQLQNVARLFQNLTERAARQDPVHLAGQLLSSLRYAEWLHDTCNDANIAARRMENVMALIGMLRRRSQQRPDAGLPALITELSLNAVLDAGADDAATDAVALMTLSAARGMEFEHVYLVGFEEGMSASAEADPAGERRSAYLGITRARQNLTFTVTEHRRLAGGVAMRKPSRFLADLPAQDLEWTSTEGGGAPAEGAHAPGAYWNSATPYPP